MQAVLVRAQSAATIQTSFFAATSPAVFSSGLATISVGAATPGAVQSLMQNLPAGIKLVTFVGSTLERQSAWATAPAAIGSPPLGLAFYDTSLSTQLFGDTVSATGWSSRTAAGV